MCSPLKRVPPFPTLACLPSPTSSALAIPAADRPDLHLHRAAGASLAVLGAAHLCAVIGISLPGAPVLGCASMAGALVLCSVAAGQPTKTSDRETSQPSQTEDLLLSVDMAACRHPEELANTGRICGFLADPAEEIERSSLPVELASVQQHWWSS